MQDSDEPTPAELMSSLTDAWERLQERHSDLEGTAPGGFYFADTLGEVDEALQAYKRALDALRKGTES